MNRKASDAAERLLILILIVSLLAGGYILGIATCRAIAEEPEIEEPVVEEVPKEAVFVIEEPEQIVEPELIFDTVEPAVEEPVETPEPIVLEPVERVSLGEFKITFYCPCSKCCGKWADGITATGTTAVAGRTIAVDPSVIPYGSEVIIRWSDGTEHSYVAEDCGGSIKNNRIDVYMDSHEEALQAGVKTAEVFIVKE